MILVYLKEKEKCTTNSVVLCCFIVLMMMLMEVKQQTAQMIFLVTPKHSQAAERLLNQQSSPRSLWVALRQHHNLLLHLRPLLIRQVSCPGSLPESVSCVLPVLGLLSFLCSLAVTLWCGRHLVLGCKCSLLDLKKPLCSHFSLKQHQGALSLSPSLHSYY